MAMATLEAALSVFSSAPHHPSLSTTTHKPFLSLNLHLSPAHSNSYKSFLSPITISKTNTTSSTANILCFELCSAIQEEASVEIEAEETQEPNNVKRKLYIFNLPWSLSVADIKNLFGVCGTVKDVEIIKQKDGKSRGFAFVTMSSGEEAQAVIDMFDSHEVSGRIIRVEFARRFRRPPPPLPPSVPPHREARHKLYVSNLAWKARSSHLKALFSEKSDPVSARVVFDSPNGRSAGYGFVSFATREEAEAAISAFDGKELMGRPVRLKFSERNVDESNSEKQDEQLEDQPSSS